MWLTIGLAVFTSGGLIFWQADEAVLTLWVMGLTACLVVGLACGGWVILWLVTHIRVSRPTTRYVMSTVGSRRGMGVIQVIAFGLGITALLMVTVMRTQLMEGWMNSLPSDTPNRFLINIQPDQRTSLMKFFAEENLTTPGLYSLTRGRWVRHNGKPVEPQSFPSLQAQRFAIVSNPTTPGQRVETRRGQVFLGKKFHQRGTLVGLDVNQKPIWCVAWERIHPALH
jgi:putative ABC transport system permease protein